MARPKKTVTENQRRSIVSRYGKGEGLISLSAGFELSPPVIRRVLVDNKVPIRGRGRPTLQT